MRPALRWPNWLAEQKMDSTQRTFRCGYVAILGRPNVGKSSLTNRLVGEKVSIISRKAQTTRHRIHGILTTDTEQFVFVDLPGYQTKHRNALNRVMNRSVVQALGDVDVVLFMVEAGRFSAADREALELAPQDRPLMLLINKVDKLADKRMLLPFIAQMKDLRNFAEILPVSATSGSGCAELLRTLGKYLPESPAMFDADSATDRSERFLAAEYVREKLFRKLGQELPYGIAVEIERFEEEPGLRRVHAAVVVERDSHKAIVIGEGGTLLKAVGTEARLDLEKLLGGRVYLELWVKVRGGWADDERALRSLGYE
ncbi:MAG: GTPase Era [Rhodocyclaceae bacterium]|nr:GTPase Era [Rhodocyclaceae bacterium]MBX3668380.1 GTPase Era [Rhodocyclaceae bacterium]